MQCSIIFKRKVKEKDKCTMKRCCGRREKHGPQDPVRSTTHLGPLEDYRTSLVYVDTLCPRLRATPERSQLPAAPIRILSRSQNNKRGERFNLGPGEAARRVPLLAGPPSWRHVLIIVHGDDELSRKPDPSPRHAANLIGPGCCAEFSSYARIHPRPLFVIL